MKLLESELKIGSNRFGMAPNIDILGLGFWASLGDALRHLNSIGGAKNNT
jgi:hypothetical protein